MKTSKALIFDIKRFAIHDGTGLRTTIFLKGCPLRCIWCQNPEGLSSKRSILYIENQCIHCMICKKHAKLNQMFYQNNRPYFNKEYKYDFNNLVQYCPANAIRYDSEEYTILKLMETIKQDEVFFRDGGGVTFSGGEPFMQAEFLIEILKTCKMEGIHTAVETSLYTSWEYIEEALPYIDIMYIDLKIFDEKNHQKFTGVSSERIKENISKILNSRYRDNVIIRTPLIPNITTDDQNLIEIARFLTKCYPSVKYELLNYNPLASSKYPLVEMEYKISVEYKMYTKKQMKHFYTLIEQAGLHNIVIE